MKNVSLKLLSLVIAIALFVFVNYFYGPNHTNQSVLQIVVPVEVKNLPSDKIIVAPQTRQVQVSLRGPPLSITRIVSNPPLFSVSLPEGVGESFVAVLNADGLKLPSDVEVLSMAPKEIAFSLERIVQKTLPIVVPQIGALPESLRLAAIELASEKVDVKGPASEVQRLKSIETAPLDLSLITESFSKSIALRVPGPLSTLSLEYVEVRVDVHIVQGEQKFDKLTLEVRSPGGESYSVDISQVRVVVAGPKQQVKDLKPADVVPFVRPDPDWPEGAPQSAAVLLDLPKGLSAVSIDPSSVQVVKKPVATATPTARAGAKRGSR